MRICPKCKSSLIEITSTESTSREFICQNPKCEFHQTAYKEGWDNMERPTEEEQLQAKFKTIIEAFGKLPQERQQKIVETVFKQMGDIVLTKIKEVGDDIKETLPVLLELMQQQSKDKEGEKE